MSSAPKASSLVVTALLAALSLRCSEFGGDDSSPAGSPSPSGAGSSNAPGGPAGSTGGSGTSGNGAPGAPIDPSTTGGSSAGGMPPVIVPPETELEQSFLAPVVTGKFVFSANPSSGRVAVIDAETYGVRLFNAGFGPKYLAAIPGERGAIVINELSHDTTLFRVSDDDVEVSGDALPVHVGANAWAISPDGRFAIAWTQNNSPLRDPTGGSQDVTVLDLERATSKRLSVGLNPSQAVIDESSARAFVVSDDGISVIALGDEPEVTLLALVSEDPLEEPATRDVSIVPDGSLAIVRVEGSTQLRAVDLTQEHALTLFDLGAPIADVDLSRDGTLAVAALPGYSQVALIPIPPTGEAASFERVTINGEIGSSVTLADDAELALLYQNGADNSHLTVVDLREGMDRAVRTVDVKGPVRAAFAAPGAASAITFQKPIAGSTKAGLFSGVPTLQKRSPKIVGTDAVPSALAFDALGQFALITVGSEASPVRGVYCMRLDTLQQDFLELASPPSVGATGIVERVGRGFVAQAYPEGRITFVELASARAHTITGFELAARIVQ
jgi:hypothetical protein